MWQLLSLSSVFLLLLLLWKWKKLLLYVHLSVSVIWPKICWYFVSKIWCICVLHRNINVSRMNGIESWHISLFILRYLRNIEFSLHCSLYFHISTSDCVLRCFCLRPIMNYMLDCFVVLQFELYENNERLGLLMRFCFVFRALIALYFILCIHVIVAYFYAHLFV